MKPLWLISACLFCTTAMAEAPNEQPKQITIPLDRIRQGTSAYNDFRELEPDVFQFTPEQKEYYSTPEGMAELREKARRSILYQIDQAFMSMLKNKKVGPGLAVEGREREALDGIYDALVKDEKPVERFPVGTEITAVVFARPTSLAIVLDGVERRGNIINVRYRLVSPVVQTLVLRSYLALIPLRDLPAGKYRVEMNRLMEEEVEVDAQHHMPVEAGVEERIVCKSFNFSVTEQP